MIFACILAGGSGTRFNINGFPKQFLELEGKSILIHTLEKFAAIKQFDKIYLGINPNFKHLAEQQIKNAKLDIEIIDGGKERHDTLINIIDAINSDGKDHNDDILVTHDAVRPFLSSKIITDNIEAAQKFGACDTAVPSSDTIIRSDKNGVISDIPPRQGLYLGQTPQSFKLGIYQEAFNKLSENEKSTLTDACSVLYKNDIPVKIVEGSALNIKITVPEDLMLAKSILSN